MIKLGRVLKKLILTLQALIGLVGLGFTAYHITVGIHDIENSQKAESCFVKSVSDTFPGAIREINSGKSDWNSLAKEIITYEVLEKKNNGFSPTKFLLEKECGDRIKISWYSYSQEAGVYTISNEHYGTHANWDMVIENIGLSLGISLFLIVILQALSVWSRWLLR